MIEIFTDRRGVEVVPVARDAPCDKLSPASRVEELKMIEFWLKERDMPKPKVEFGGG